VQPVFCCCDLDMNVMTLKLEGYLDILKTYLHTENEDARLRHLEVLMEKLHQLTSQTEAKPQANLPVHGHSMYS